MIVEDNTANIFALEHFLRYHGFNLAVAGNGREAIQQVLSLRPNLVLMDIQMPEMDGITAIKHIRADKAIAKTPIIAVSASVMPGDKERSLPDRRHSESAAQIGPERPIVVIPEQSLFLAGIYRLWFQMDAR